MLQAHMKKRTMLAEALATGPPYHAEGQCLQYAAGDQQKCTACEAPYQKSRNYMESSAHWPPLPEVALSSCSCIASHRPKDASNWECWIFSFTDAAASPRPCIPPKKTGEYIGGWGVSPTGKSFRVVRACARSLYP